MARAWHNFIRPIITRFRKKRGRLILDVFPNLKTMRVLDLGGSVHFWFETGLIANVGEVIIYNISYAEVNIANEKSEKIQFRIYDGLHLPEDTQAFDLVLCNSVLEHIPAPIRAQVAQEMVRVGKQGFVQTPALEFPIEPHFVLPFIHWLPKHVGRYLVRVSPWALLSRQPTVVQDAYFAEVNLLAKADLMKLFPRAAVRAERFIGLPKAWVATW